MDAFIGEIRMFPYTFAPQGWLACDGRLQSIQQYPALNAILGTNFGGDGQRTFGLPNLQGCAPVGVGTGPGLSPVALAKIAGTESVTLSSSQTSSHTHAMMGMQLLGTSLPPGPTLMLGVRGKTTKTIFMYASPGSVDPTTIVSFAPGMIGPSGGNSSGSALPHENRQPSLCMGFYINYDGIYPVNND